MTTSAHVLNEYKAAQKVANETPRNTRVNRVATDIISQLRDKQVTFVLNCMLCGERFTHETTVDDAASYMQAPRGVCSNHDEDGDTRTVLVLV